MEKIKTWINQNKKEFIILTLILLVASFLRLYRIDEYMTFLGDEGRDAIIVRRLLVDFDPILVGPGTSIGNMYLGPLYYYFIAPGLLLAGFSPAGPSIQIALFGVVTVAMVWFIGREWFGKWAGLFAAGLYAIAPTIVIFSRSSWNPNIMPFVALLSVYAIWRVWQYLEYRWLLVLGFSYAFVLQSHYIGLVLLPLLGIFWLLTVFKSRKEKDLKRLFEYSFTAGVIFMILMSPLVIFDARHGWRNFDALRVFFTDRQTTVSAKPWNALPNSWPLLQTFGTRLLAGRDEAFGTWVSVALLGSALAAVTAFRKKYIPTKVFHAFLIVFGWLGLAVIGLGVYKQHIYDHYFGFFFPAPFLIIGGVSQVLIQRAKIRGWWIVVTMMIFLVFYNLKDSPILYQPNRQLQRTETIAQKIIEEANGNPYNLAVIAERNYEDAYQYFLEKEHSQVVEIDPQRSEETITDQLFVVCELENKEECDPTHNAKAEVANFGWSQIADQWDIEGIRIYKLIHTEPEQ